MTGPSFVTEGELLRWSSFAQPFPLPIHRTPTTTDPFRNISDEELLNAPPQMIAHIQRTVAQGGMQIVSPRQTPITWTMGRIVEPDRQLGDHVVGSIAEDDMEWPTLDDADFSMLLPDQPLPHMGPEQLQRTKTKTEPLTSADVLLDDPILNCLVKGRAVVDILRRPDVMGGAEDMAELIASAWGMDTEEFMAMDAYTLGVDGPLLRHALKADEVYPTIHAPIQIKRVISVGASEVTREYLPDDSAMDWRRMRVFAEAVFSMSCEVEGLPIKRMKANPPPGDPVAPLNRANTLAFRPAPCTAWTFAPHTFCITPVKSKVSAKGPGLPREVMQAMVKYTAIVCPVSHVLNAGNNPKTRKSVMKEVTAPWGETIRASYEHMAKHVMIGAARGRTAAATVRNFIYEALDEAPVYIATRIARYVNLAKTETKVHLGLTTVPDLVVDRIACKFLQIGELIRVKIVSEAARRGTTAEAWWGDIVAQAPERYKVMSEGTLSWARVAMWLVFRGPTDNWDRLVKAVNYNALRSASKKDTLGMALPAAIGSVDRLVVATRGAVKNITKAYAGYYMGVADVGLALADVADSLGNERKAKLLREASYMWVLRARAYRGSNAVPVTDESPVPSEHHFRITGHPVDMVLVPSPYRAFDAYRAHAMQSEVLPAHYKGALAAQVGGKVSDIFRKIGRTVVPMADSVVSRYMVDPRRLANDMEAAWRMLTEDITEVCQTISGEAKRLAELTRLTEAPPDVVTDTLKIGKAATAPAASAGIDYFTLLAELSPDEVDGIEAELAMLPQASADMVMEGSYASKEDLVNLVCTLIGQAGLELGGPAGLEAVQ